MQDFFSEIFAPRKPTNTTPFSCRAQEATALPPRKTLALSIGRAQNQTLPHGGIAGAANFIDQHRRRRRKCSIVSG
ncbi:MAG: hypothetical protein DME60_00360 [Verrucomicrobia bacterium]|nr:MAG: hypothetical protein DME60_00360 [Verrucomicrobiota bacterium]